MKLSNFDGAGYAKGRSMFICALWLAVSSTVFQRWWLPSVVRVKILRAFGAKVGERVLVRHRVRIHWPWKLSISDDVWIGEGAWILNLEPVRIGTNVCISQDVVICAGSHKYFSDDFAFDNSAVTIEDDCWLALKSVVLRGVTVGAGSLVGATAVVYHDVPRGSRVRAPKSTTS